MVAVPYLSSHMEEKIMIRRLIRLLIGRREPSRAPVANISIIEAMDKSAKYGYRSVDWSRVIWS